MPTDETKETEIKLTESPDDVLPVVESSDETAVVPASKGDVVLLGADKMVPQRPAKMSDEDASGTDVQVREMMVSIKEDPGSIELSMEIDKLGGDSANAMIPHTQLFEKKLSVVMEDSKPESPTNMTLTQLKRHLDTVNPSIVRNEEIDFKEKFMGIFNRTVSRVPKGSELLDIIYERKETVGSVVNGLKERLFEQKDMLQKNMVDLVGIYKGLQAGNVLLQRDIYFGQLLHVAAKEFCDTLEAGSMERINMEQFLADLTSIVLGLMTQEAANLQFFAGTQDLSRGTRGQVSNITRYSRLMQDTVLANLGMRVAAKALEASVETTNMMKDTIGNTMVDTAKTIARTGEAIVKSRADATINLDKLEEGFNILNEHYENMAKGNQQIIEFGTKTSARMQAMTETIRNRVESGHSGLLGSDTKKKIAEGGAE